MELSLQGRGFFPDDEKSELTASQLRVQYPNRSLTPLTATALQEKKIKN